ncbi:unnamed protein product [Prorocentrum cordatum]|uniref:RRM domain-containing protein n=1 Tax=Prorocentrum cordatum TaxID=2364126 RepID=A0ABN9UV70_9DINO|nr:unnamed protein product [Polarella glacialis]
MSTEARAALHQAKGKHVRWVREGGRDVSNRSQWPVPYVNLEVMRHEDVYLAAAYLGTKDCEKDAAPGGRGVFMSCLPPGVSEQEVREVLGAFGAVASVSVAARRADARPPAQAVALAEFEDAEAAAGACAASACGVFLDGHRVRIAPQRPRRQPWAAWRHGSAPAWRLQRCSACSFAVTGVLPHFCCRFCEKTPGGHGPACRRLPWRALHRPRSLSCA